MESLVFRPNGNLSAMGMTKSKNGSQIQWPPFILLDSFEQLLHNQFSCDEAVSYLDPDKVEACRPGGDINFVCFEVSGFF